MSGKLSIITWNVWFDELEQRIRYGEILSICEQLNPDVICFQEVIPFFVGMIKDSVYFMNNYSCSDPRMDGRTVGSYGVLTLSKKSLNARYGFREFPTRFGRKLLVTEFEHCGEFFAVGNVHLESLSNHPIREQQMEISNTVLSQYKHSVLCGDFNFCSLRNFGNDTSPLNNLSLGRVMPEFVDLWELLKQRGSEPSEGAHYCGFTFDTTANPMVGDKHERMRYDRVVLRSVPDGGDTKQWHADSIQIIGDSPILDTAGGTAAPSTSLAAAASPTAAESGYATPPAKSSGGRGRPKMVLPRGRTAPIPLFPSDHFGLHAEFVLGSADSADGGNEKI